MTSLSVPIRQLPHAEGLPLPHYATEGASGMDLRAAVPEDCPISLAAGARFAVPTGLVLELPEGYEAQIRSRSGLSLKAGIVCANSPGTIDWDYRGEIKVILINHGHEDFTIARGDRIAQMVFAPVTRATLIPATEISETTRGGGGFGSTGVA